MKKRSRCVLKCSSKMRGDQNRKKKKTKNKNPVLKKSQKISFVFFSRPKYLLCKYMMSRVRSAKRVSSAAKTAAEAFSKLCHVVREGERKQLLFPLSKMAEGRGKAARSREEDPRPPSRSGEGWATRPASLPSFFSSSIMLFVPLAGSRCGRMTYSCVVSAPEALLGHRAGGRQPAGCGSHTATAPRRAGRRGPY